MPNADLYAPPFPDEDYDRERVEHTRLRRRMLSGAWGPDLDQFLAREIGPVRHSARRNKRLEKISSAQSRERK
jgi:hypothetical protein